MEPIFDSFAKSIYNFNGHKGYIIQWKLVAPFCKKWSGNRDPDMQRVNEMVECYKNGGYIPRMIHLAETKEEGIVCYDGNHRKETFNECKDSEIICIVDIMFNSTQNEIYKSFNNINKSVQLPAIYLEERKDNRDEIISLVKQYEIKYKDRLSTSARCNAPNFNRDTFTDNIDKIYKLFDGTVSVELIGKLLERLNFEYSQNKICRSHSLYKEPLLEKCRKYGLWLFIEREIPFEHVECVNRLINLEKLKLNS
jgi:hypothetical protein